MRIKETSYLSRWFITSTFPCRMDVMSGDLFWWSLMLSLAPLGGRASLGTLPIPKDPHHLQVVVFGRQVQRSSTHLVLLVYHRPSSPAAPGRLPCDASPEVHVPETQCGISGSGLRSSEASVDLLLAHTHPLPLQLVHQQQENIGVAVSENE